MSSGFRTKKRKDGSTYIHPLELSKGLPHGKPALRKNIHGLKVENKEKFLVEEPKSESKPKEPLPPPSVSAVSNVPQKPVKEKTTDGT
jgi:hypothetical protein